MQQNRWRQIGLAAVGFLGVWLGARYLLPVLLPFVLGLLLALAAEPAVGVGTRLHLPRWAAAGVGVTLTLVLGLGIIGVLGAALVKELGVLAGRLPDLQRSAQQAQENLRVVLETAADRAPDGVRPLVERSIDGLFSSSDTLLEQASVRLPRAVTAVLGRVPDGALGIGTAVLSAFMLSARLPRLREGLRAKLPARVREHFLPAVRRGKRALLGWLKAQGKLAGITFLIVTVGLVLLRVPYAPLWALPVALVDAVPMLGTGTVLVPWALVSLLQGQNLRAAGLLCLCAVSALTRTSLEPRFLGRHLGLDPLVTLLCLYLGFRFWGFLGMVLSPMLAAAVMAATQTEPKPQ